MKKSQTPSPHARLSRRERQIMEILYQTGPASVSNVLAALPDPPSYSAVRAALRILEEKGHVQHTDEGVKYLFQATVPKDKATGSALQQLLSTFFNNSAAQAVCTLLEAHHEKLSPTDWERIEKLVQDARQGRADS